MDDRQLTRHYKTRSTQQLIVGAVTDERDHNALAQIYKARTTLGYITVVDIDGEKTRQIFSVAFARGRRCRAVRPCHAVQPMKHCIIRANKPK